MPLVRLDKVALNFGTHILLDEVNFTLKKGSKIGLLGRNGAGKTTFMKVIAGSMQPDSGERWLRPGVEVAWLEQSLPEADEQSVYDMVAGGLSEVGDLLKQYHHMIADYENADMAKLERVQGALEAKQGWSLGQKVDTVITNIASFAKGFNTNYKELKLHNAWLRENKLNNKSRKLYKITIPIK